VAQRKGREWLVHRPGSNALEPMDEERFAAFQREVGARGGTLVTLSVTGERARDVAATLCRYVGGILHGETLAQPAVVRATPQGIERAFFASGHRLDVPRQQAGPAEPAVAVPAREAEDAAAGPALR
jgi:hypothetical protein